MPRHIGSPAITQAFIHHVMIAAPSAVIRWPMTGFRTDHTRPIPRVSSSIWGQSFEPDLSSHRDGRRSRRSGFRLSGGPGRLLSPLVRTRDQDASDPGTLEGGTLSTERRGVLRLLPQGRTRDVA